LTDTDPVTRPGHHHEKGRTMMHDDDDDRGYDLADMMSGARPLPSRIDLEKWGRIIEDHGGLDAVDWEDLDRCEAAILAREDQSNMAARAALLDLHAPDGISEAGMVEYLDSKGALPGRKDMELTVTIRVHRELGGRLPRRRKGRRPPRPED
jgi:hypothetical protein